MTKSENDVPDWAEAPAGLSVETLERLEAAAKPVPFAPLLLDMNIMMMPDGDQTSGEYHDLEG